MENIQKYIELANMAFESKQYGEAVNYYLKAIEIEPTNYYLHYRKSLATALQVTPFEVASRGLVVAAEKYIQNSSNPTEAKKEVFSDVLDYYRKAFRCIEDYRSPLSKGAMNAAVQNMAMRPTWNQDNAAYMSLDKYVPIHKKCMNELLESGYQLITSINCINELQEDDFKKIYAETLGAMLFCYFDYLKSEYPNSKNIAKELYSMFLKYADSDQKQKFSLSVEGVAVSYSFQINSEGQVVEKPSGGCYVATAVYGSYDCPQVWTLRRYRDYSLAKTWYGRMFIRSYYAVSPTIVKYFGKTEWFKNFWRNKLDKMIQNLQENGVESTPYEDQKW